MTPWWLRFSPASQRFIVRWTALFIFGFQVVYLAAYYLFGLVLPLWSR